MKPTFSILETLLLSVILTACRSANNPKASLLAQNRVSNEFGNAVPQWAVSKNCDTSSSDFYVCMYFVGVSGYRSVNPYGPGGNPPPPPRLFKTFSVSTQSVTGTPDGNYSVKVRVDGTCAFSEPGNLFGQPYRCGGADKPYQSVFDVKVHQAGLFGADWTVVSAARDNSAAKRRTPTSSGRTGGGETEGPSCRRSCDCDQEQRLCSGADSLQNGADPNADLFQAPFDYPLMAAKTPELAELLIKFGADVDGKGHTPPCPICEAASRQRGDKFKVL